MRAHRLLYVAAWAVAALIVAIPFAYERLFPEPNRFPGAQEHFLYGSVGVEPASGVPYEIWRTLPGICMPAAERATGFHRFGFQWPKGRATPIGMPLETAIVPRVGVNCALCHVGSVEGPQGTSLLIGAPNATLNLQAYLRFLFSCVQGPNFTADNIFHENARLGGDLGPLQRLFYRAVIIPQMRSAVALQARQFGFMDGQPDWGPGRVPGFQPAKAQVLGRAYDGTLDIVDMPALWHLQDRVGGSYHWDGVNTSLHEVFLNSGIGNGATARTINIPSLDLMEVYTTDLAAPRFPFPVNRALAARGEAVWSRACADCHAPGGGKTNQVIPIGWVGTDRERLDSLTPDTIAGFAALADYTWRYEHFRKTNGYLATTLTGIWARAPYLHNGSVPTLAALLTAPEARPISFRRGGTRYDPVAVGFADEGPFVFDTRLPGNSAGGHRWGTDLPPDQRLALIEYLKTL
jgi:hypothetical protein